MAHSNNGRPARPTRYALALLALPWVLGACHAAAAPPLGADRNPAGASHETKGAPVHMTIGTRRFAITLADGPAARAFAAQLPLNLRMADLNANEKHAELPGALPANASRPGSIRNGELMLYGSATLVLFYRTFASSYSYTRLGRVHDPAALAEALGTGDVQVRFAMDKT